jgi:CSLREA domain-containing protein
VIRANFQTKTFQLVLIMTLAGLMLAAGVGLIPLPPLLPGPEAHAAGTINVTTTGDEYNTSGSGSGCALREAIESVNTSSSFGGCSNPGNAADTIQLQAMTYTLSIPRPTSPPFDDSNAVGDIEPKQSMTIRGVGSEQTVISTTTAFNDGVFYIASGFVNATIGIEAVTIQGSKPPYGSGGISIFMYGVNPVLTLVDVVIQNNKVGGIYHFGGLLSLNDVTIRNNESTFGGGGLYSETGAVIMNNVTLYGNRANSVFGEASGGAIYINDYPATYATNSLQMTNVTIYDNQAQVSGGGLYLNFSQNPPWGTVPIVVTATNVTFASNQAVSGSGGNIYNNQSTFSLQNTIIANGLANGSPNNCGGNPVPNITSSGYNLDSGNTCGLTATGDITNINPLLAASLADNGGSTETLALLTGSPAINSGTCSGAPATDQRGVTRPQGSTCDIGAYEAGNQPNFPVYLPTIRKH